VYALLRSQLLIVAREIGFVSRFLSSMAPLPKTSEASWRDEYASGEWDRLWDIGELGHYTVVAGYFGRMKPGGSVLDVACGEGILRKHLQTHGYSRYLGIDVTPEAIATASKSKDERTDFVVADATRFATDQRFDVIIFNECLYYFADPMAIVNRYCEFLEEDGIVIVSNFNSLVNLGTIDSIRKTFDIDDEVSLINRGGISWTVQLARPKRNETGDRHAA
jgi:2-polyprenyl-3-methyl-5-hydroxy-6-metoxy-1,4-benzoquinol methylase